MKKISRSKLIKGIIVGMLGVFVLVVGIGYYCYRTYKSINIPVNKCLVLEYGTKDYKVEDFIKNVDGKVVDIENKIDTSKLGEQEVIVTIEKNMIRKEVPLVVEVQDKIAPTIEIKEETLEYTQGDGIDLNGNINSIIDKVDGDIAIKGEDTTEEEAYYTIDTDSNIEDVGEHVITVNVKDKNGNTSSKQFTINTVAKPAPAVYTPQQRVYAQAPANVSGNSMVQMAYSLVGQPYRSGGSAPGGFDCSGLVAYIYRQHGINISSGSYAQASLGVEVGYANAQPGDIIIWGHGSQPTHSSIYVGNGLIVHATNPSQGVIVSGVDYWNTHSDARLLSVRRIS